MTKITENPLFRLFIMAQIDDKPKKTYAYTKATANENSLYELPDDAIIIKMEGMTGDTKIIYYLTEVDPNMPPEEPWEGT